jgi:hypothetical protein
MFPKLMNKLADWNLYEFIPKKTINFFKEFIEDTITRRKNKELVRVVLFKNLIIFHLKK